MEKLITPCYIFDLQRLERNYTDMVDSFSDYWPNFIIGYSYKTNSLPFLINWMKEKGALAEVVSSPEYKLAKYIGYQDKDIILNGPWKGFEILDTALKGNAIVNLDNFSEIKWLKENPPKDQTYYIGIRINFDLEKICPGETLMGQLPGRFGFNIENGDLHKAIKMLKNIPNVKIVGIHAHHSTKSKSLKIFETLAKKINEVAEIINNPIKYIDIGGGIYGDKVGAPSYSDYASVIVNQIAKKFNPQDTALILEPGISLAATCFSFLCEVIDTKQIKDYHIVTTNGSTMQIDPQMNGRKFVYEILRAKKSHLKSVVQEQYICGYTCIEKDRFAVIENEALFMPNDKIIFKNAGAYTLSFTPLFIEYFPTVYLKQNNKYSIIREKWEVEEYIQKSKISLL